MCGKMWYSEPNDKLSPKEGYEIAVGLELGWCKMTQKKIKQLAK